jgi:L-fuconolactonase
MYSERSRPTHPNDAFAVDSHVHTWELSVRPQPWIDHALMPALARDHPVHELAGELRRTGVSAAILVQVLNDPAETVDYLEAAAGSDVIAGVVGWADLLDPALSAQLDQMANHPSGGALVGVRHQALAEPDPAGWLRCASDGGGIRTLGERGLALDLIFRPEHLAVVAEVVRANPGTAFVLDHAGKAPIATGWASEEAQRWAGLVRDLARCGNLTCKVSGLTTMADLAHWTAADLAPFVDHLLACFGAGRLMYGSDWPVSLRAGEYQKTLGAVVDLISTLSGDERAAILGRTATRVYAIDRVNAP